MEISRIATAYAGLAHDDWRNAHPFSPEVASANASIAAASSSPEIQQAIISAWLQKHQPCLFGRLAAKLGQLHFCILAERDLLRSDGQIRDLIQEQRLAWTRAGFEGRRSGFVILALSERLATARPDANLRALAQLLAGAYLLRDVEVDSIYHDEIFLEKPGSGRTTWKWLVGVNYFAANGDRRWWQDHRIPGGIALSMNSVGHMAKSGMIARAWETFQADIRVDLNEFAPSHKSDIDSLGRALEFAMRTIALASDGPSGPATLLRPRLDSAVASCPIELPQFLRDKDHCQYLGYYHTDFTLPSEYFLEDERRPVNKAPAELDFTYLFDRQYDNPDAVAMGEGRRVRAFGSQASGLERTKRVGRAFAEEVSVDSQSRLLRSLSDGSPLL